MRIYLDNCCYNRPYNDQSQEKIKKETEAILLIQEMIIAEEVELAWSYILDYENSFNPFPEKRYAIEIWKDYSQIDIKENDDLLETAFEISKFKLSAKDSLHIVSAIYSGCKYFITTDEHILNRLSDYTNIIVMNPINFLLTHKK